MPDGGVNELSPHASDSCSTQMSFSALSVTPPAVAVTVILVLPPLSAFRVTDEKESVLSCALTVAMVVVPEVHVPQLTVPLKPCTSAASEQLLVAPPIAIDLGNVVNTMPATLTAWLAVTSTPS